MVGVNGDHDFDAIDTKSLIQSAIICWTSHSIPATRDMPADQDAEMPAAEDFKVEMVLKKRLREGIVEYYVKWMGYPDTDNTWEPEQLLHCPQLIKQFNARHAATHVPVKKETTSPPVKVKKEEKDVHPGKKVKRETMAIDQNATQQQKRKPQTGRPSIVPRNKVSDKIKQENQKQKIVESMIESDEEPVIKKEKDARSVSLVPVDGPVACKRPYSFELGVRPIAISGFSIQQNKLYYLIAYKDGEEWTPSEWAEHHCTGLADVLIPYYEQVMQQLDKE